jgi:AcrR family transcriptional regulator
MTVPDPRRRRSILQATIDVAATVGFRGLTVDDIAATAGIAPRTFYRYFPSKQSAFEAGHRAICDEVLHVVRHGLTTEETPYARAVACLTNLTTYLAADPARAQVLLIEGPAAGPITIAACTETMDDLAEVLTEISGGRPQIAGVPPVVAEVVVGGVHEVVRTRAATGRLDELPGFVPALVRILATPYGGGRDPRCGAPAAVIP